MRITAAAGITLTRCARECASAHAATFIDGSLKKIALAFVAPLISARWIRRGADRHLVEPARNSAMVRTRASVMSAETVAPIATLRGRTGRLFSVLGMCGRVNPFSIFVDVRTMFDQLRFVRCRHRWRRAGESCERCDQRRAENDLHENFHADLPSERLCNRSWPMSRRAGMRRRARPRVSPDRARHRTRR